MRIKDLLKKLEKEGLTKKELKEIIKEFKKRGFRGQIIAVDDLHSTDALIVQEYLRYHKALSKTPRKISSEEIEEAKNALEKKSLTLEEKKKIIVFLGHSGKKSALEILRNHFKRAKGEWKTWFKIAYDECLTFSKKRPQITITKFIRKDLLDIVPYEYCDNFCPRCKRKDTCQIFQERISFERRCFREGKNPNDPQVIYEEVRRKIIEGFKALKEKAKEKGIEILRPSKKEIEKEKVIHQKIISSGIFRKAIEFRQTADIFLQKIFFSLRKNPFSMFFLKDDLINLLHYSGLIESKLYRALFDQEKKEKEDSLRSGAIVKEALEICCRALKNIFEWKESTWIVESLFLATKIRELRKKLLKKFPQIEKYKKKIIVNT